MLVPRRVVLEYQVKAAPTDPDLEHLPWLTVVDGVVIDATLPLLPHTGEAAVRSLAGAVRARLLLIDEAKARRIAVGRGFQVAGTLGSVLRAKHQGRVAAVRPVIEQMRAQGRWFSPALIAEILRQAGE